MFQLIDYQSDSELLLSKGCKLWNQMIQDFGDNSQLQLSSIDGEEAWQ